MRALSPLAEWFILLATIACHPLASWILVRAKPQLQTWPLIAVSSTTAVGW
jgi:hypothetical protein